MTKDALATAEARGVQMIPELRSNVVGICAKLRHLLRDAAERTADATWRRHVSGLLDQFPPDECANDFRNSGYASK